MLVVFLVCLVCVFVFFFYFHRFDLITLRLKPVVINLKDIVVSLKWWVFLPLFFFLKDTVLCSLG